MFRLSFTDTLGNSDGGRGAVSISGTYGSKWSDAEFEMAISSYRRLLRKENNGEAPTKSDVVKQLVAALGRTKAAVELRFQNISAVLDERGATWIDGYKPMRHYPRRLRELIDETLPW
jgi:hypothetical protein